MDFFTCSCNASLVKTVHNLYLAVTLSFITPTRTVVHVEAEVRLPDGEVVIFDFPENGNGFGALRQYRWRKYLRRVRLSEYRRLWASTAEWVAQQFDDEVEMVRLIREQAVIPGPLSDTLEFERESFFTWEP